MAVSQASVPLTLLLSALIALTSLGTDMFLPSLPAIARELGAGASAAPGGAQIAVTTYLVGLAIGQFAWGPISDRYGRKPALLAGLCLFLAASAGCAAADSLPALAQLRFAQGLGMSSGPVIARSIVRDLYAREQAATLLARMMALFAVVPVTAPLIGGQTVALSGWQAVFWVYAAIALALFAAVASGFTETAPAERPSIAPGRIYAGYRQLFGDARFRAALAVMVCAQMGIIAFVASSGLAVVQALGLSPAAFSVLFSAAMSGQIFGGLAAARLLHRVGIARAVRLGAALLACAGGAFAALAFAGAAHWSAVVLPMFVYLFGSVLVVPNAIAAALTPFPRIAGAASSLLGAIPFGLGALVSALLGAVFDGSMRPMALAIALFGLLAFAGERLLFRKAPHG